MHKVEPSGVVLHGVCDIQTDRCTAKAGGAITAVWGPAWPDANQCVSGVSRRKDAPWRVDSRGGQTAAAHLRPTISARSSLRLSGAPETWRSVSRTDHTSSKDNEGAPTGRKKP